MLYFCKEDENGENMTLGRMLSSLPDNLSEEDLKRFIALMVEIICERQKLVLTAKAKEELVLGITKNLLSKSQGKAIAKEALLDPYYQNRPSMNVLQLVTFALALTLTLQAYPKLQNTISDLLISQAIRTHAPEFARGQIHDLQLLTEAQKKEIQEMSKHCLHEINQTMQLGTGVQNQQTVDSMAVALLGLVANIAGAMEAEKTSIKSVIFQLANMSIDTGSSLTPESARDKPELQLSTGAASLFSQVLETVTIEHIKDNMNSSTPRYTPPGGGE